MTTKWAVMPLAILAAMLMLAAIAAAPGQDQGKRPLGPLLQDYYSGTVTVQGSPAPAGTQLIACVDSCATYHTAAVSIGESGAYTGLTLEPTDYRMIGRDVTFHIVNQHGSIQAEETGEFYGVYDLYTQNLTFLAALPAPPTPTPTSRRPRPRPPRRPSRPPRPRRRPRQRRNPPPRRSRRPSPTPRRRPSCP